MNKANLKAEGTPRGRPIAPKVSGFGQEEPIPLVIVEWEDHMDPGYNIKPDRRSAHPIVLPIPYVKCVAGPLVGAGLSLKVPIQAIYPVCICASHFMRHYLIVDLTPWFVTTV